jgi:hypothetical protein
MQMAVVTLKVNLLCFLSILIFFVAAHKL